MDLPQRKYPRLKHYDYSTPGAYFITICTQGKRCLLSRIVGRGLAPAETVLTRSGQIAKRELELLPSRYQGTVIEHFVIMPNHIHFIVRISDIAAGASPRPTVMDMVCTYKSLTARACKEEQNIDKLFQTSFYDHVIRNTRDYEEIAKYIWENPQRWTDDEFYEE